MKKSQVDLENALVHIEDSKTPSGVGDMPMTDLAYQAFKSQMEETPGSDYLFPRLKPRGKKAHIGSLKKVWEPPFDEPAWRISRCTSCVILLPRA